MLEGSCHCGQVSWIYPLELNSVTACNCTLCSRYGALWAYGYLEDGIKSQGETKAYVRGSQYNSYNFCTTCGCLAYYQANHIDNEGRRRIAVNTRMTLNPDLIVNILIDHFDGLNKFEDLPSDGKCVKDIWF